MLSTKQKTRKLVLLHFAFAVGCLAAMALTFLAGVSRPNMLWWLLGATGVFAALNIAVSMILFQFASQQEHQGRTELTGGDNKASETAVRSG